MLGLLVIFRGCIRGPSGRKGGGGEAGFGWGGGDLTQPPVNFSKFLV